jgi:2-polyprenyl-6-methoxyphenol hydroxylase-like FAD-dependent oxidoreductase
MTRIVILHARFCKPPTGRQTRGPIIQEEQMADRNCVVIVGAGPVGLVSAVCLARSGIPSVLLEASPTTPRDLRASTVHPPTLDMLDEIGVADDYIKLGVITECWQVIHLGTRERVLFDLSAIRDDTRHPYRLQCEQYHLSPILLERAKASGLVDIHLGAEVTEVSQDDDKVVARASVDGEPREFEGRYLIGADGAHSVVRRGLGFPLEGFTYEYSTTLITTPFRFEDEIPELVGANYTWTSLDAGSMFRLRDEWRCTFYPRPGEADVELTDDVIESRMQGILDRPEPYEVREKRNYRIHQRIVPDYRAGRIVLAGDAAHVTPPTGGLGMNGGIHDAVNLADKLARVCNGESDGLLDLYTRQRRPVAVAEILAQSHQNRIRMQLWDPEQRKEVMAHMRDIAADPERSKQMLLRTSMIEGLRQAAAVE